MYSLCLRRTFILDNVPKNREAYTLARTKSQFLLMKPLLVYTQYYAPVTVAPNCIFIFISNLLCAVQHSILPYLSFKICCTHHWFCYLTNILKILHSLLVCYSQYGLTRDIVYKHF
jgi:hypothetical protein